ncbi:hypothetical protein ACS0TY_018477 [Phlomoides rotata]
MVSSEDDEYMLLQAQNASIFPDFFYPTAVKIRISNHISHYIVQRNEKTHRALTARRVICFRTIILGGYKDGLGMLNPIGRYPEFLINDIDCISILRMDRNNFGRLYFLMRELGGLIDHKYVSVEEQVSIFLSILAHHKKNRTISHYVHLVLKAVLKLHKLFLVEPTPVLNDSTDSRWNLLRVSLLLLAKEGSLHPGRYSYKCLVYGHHNGHLIWSESYHQHDHQIVSPNFWHIKRLTLSVGHLILPQQLMMTIAMEMYVVVSMKRYFESVPQYDQPLPQTHNVIV